MPTTFDVAHFHEQGQDVILVITTGEPSDRQWRYLQRCATDAGLRGLVAAVWDAGAGLLGFYGPEQWRPFLEGLTPAFVSGNINGRLTCR